MRWSLLNKPLLTSNSTEATVNGSQHNRSRRQYHRNSRAMVPQINWPYLTLRSKRGTDRHHAGLPNNLVALTSLQG